MTRPADVSLQIEFLAKENHGIGSWLIVAPQRKSSFGSPLCLNGTTDLAVKERHRGAGRGFQVFGEPMHRVIAEFLAGVEPGKSKLGDPNDATEALHNLHRGIFLLYPVREDEQDKIKVSIGFELLYPINGLGFDISFTVRRKAESSKIVVEH
jgi:hypothetical protein